MTGSYDALVKIASNYMLEKFKAKIQSLANTMSDYAVMRQHGIAKYYSRLSKLMEDNQDHVALQVDISGAYPNISRAQIRESLHKHLPEFIGIFDTLYSGPCAHKILSSDAGTIKVEQNTGLTQGSELSSLFFAIATDSPFESRREQHWSQHYVKYADDITLVGTPQQVQEDYAYLANEFAKMDLQFKPEKIPA